MTPDFREGLIGGFERSLEIIKDLLANSKETPETAQPLEEAAESIRLEMQEAERG